MKTSDIQTLRAVQLQLTHDRARAQGVPQGSELSLIPLDECAEILRASGLLNQSLLAKKFETYHIMQYANGRLAAIYQHHIAVLQRGGTLRYLVWQQ